MNNYRLGQLFNLTEFSLSNELKILFSRPDSLKSSPKNINII